MLLAVETSCDETAAAVLDPAKGRISESLLANIVSSQVEFHQPYGGVVPELAARKHISNLPIVVQQAFEQAGISLQDLSAVAVTRGPGLKVCLLVGLAWARSLAWGLGLPLLGINHLEGHLLAHELNPDGEDAPYPRLVLLVSGGHTALVLVKAYQDYQIVAETEDDAAGEAFDKSATVIGLPYPGGPALSRLAAEGNDQRFVFPIGVRKEDSRFSFSGMKTAVVREAKQQDLSQHSVQADLAAGVEKAIVSALLLKTKAALKKFGPASFILAGGVAANSRLRAEASQLAVDSGIDFHLAPPELCTDNAAMIGVAGLHRYRNRTEDFLGWDPRAKVDGVRLAGPGLSLDFGPLSRWPLSESLS